MAKTLYKQEELESFEVLEDDGDYQMECKCGKKIVFDKIVDEFRTGSIVDNYMVECPCGKEYVLKLMLRIEHYEIRKDPSYKK